MNTGSLDRLRSRIVNIDVMPAIPVIIRPLLQCLDQPPEQINFSRIVELVSYDKSIAAQCVRMANSATFGQRYPVESVRVELSDLDNRLEPGHIGHFHVKRNDVWIQLRDFGQCYTAVRRCTRHLDAGIGCKRITQDFPDDRGIIHD